VQEGCKSALRAAPFRMRAAWMPQTIQRLLLAPTPTWSQLQQSNLDSQCPAYIGGSTGMHRLQDISTAAGLVSRDRVAPACALAAVAIILLRSSMAAAMEDDVAGLT